MRRVALLWLAVVALASCSPDPAHAPAHRASDPRLDSAVRRALDWSATLEVDPIRLRRDKGMKGIKHFVEYLAFQQVVSDWASDPEIERTARERALAALRVVDEDGYHDLAAAGPERFNQESMSYLRACRIAEQLGRDTSRYRREILEILPRIHAHLPGRGVDQRMEFAVLLAQLGMARPESEDQIYPRSLIARHAPLSFYLASPERPYALTHEIFGMTARGTRAFPFPNEDDERYAKATVERLLDRAVESESTDIAAELLLNLVELGEPGAPVARRATQYLYRAQNADGSFGNYEAEAAALREIDPRYDIGVGAYLHTTYVAVWALIEASRHG